MRAAHHSRGKAVNRAAGKKYRENNRDKIRREHKIKYDSDPVYRIGFILRRRLLHAVHAASANKDDTSFELLGCSPREYALYLGIDQLSNYKEVNLHVDHIWPIALYDLSDPCEQRKAFDYRNTRLCSAVENQEKGAKPPSAALASTVPCSLWPRRWIEFYD